MSRRVDRGLSVRHHRSCGLRLGTCRGSTFCELCSETYSTCFGFVGVVRGHRRSVVNFVGWTSHSCRCTVRAVLPGEMGKLKRLKEFNASSNGLQGKYLYVLAMDNVGIYVK